MGFRSEVVVRESIRCDQTKSNNNKKPNWHANRIDVGSDVAETQTYKGDCVIESVSDRVSPARQSELNKSPQCFRPTHLIFHVFSMISGRACVCFPPFVSWTTTGEKKLLPFTYNFRWRNLIKRFWCVRNAVQMTHSTRYTKTQTKRADRPTNQPERAYTTIHIVSLRLLQYSSPELFTMRY